MAQMNLSIEKKIIGLQNRLVVAKGAGEGEGVGWTGNWVNRYELIAFEMHEQ